MFTGSIAELYEQNMVPLIFEPYAVDLAARVAKAAPKRVLELACGTGVVTRLLASRLQAELVASDLNPAMLEHAAKRGTARPVEWRQIDAMQLPFGDAEFDAVVCQFGVMFLPDKPRAYAEARRVLRPGGLFAFNSWGSLANNQFADVAQGTLAALFPADPPRFMASTPHGYHRAEELAQHLAAAGFTQPPHIEAVTLTSRAPSADFVAVAYCQGTPMRGEIEARDPNGLARVTREVAAALTHRFGSGPVEGRIEALVVTVTG